MRSRRALRWFVGLAVLVAASTALARAGGGQNYSSSSHSSYSGGSGGGGGDVSGLIFLVLQLTWDYPYVMIPLLAAFFFMAWLTKRHPPAETADVYQELDRLSARPLPNADSEIRNSDSAFDRQEFLKCASDVFLRVQAAWSQQKMPEVRSFVSDGVLSRFIGQQRLMRVLGVRNLVADVQVNNRQILAGRVAGEYQLLDVRFDASARDADVPTELPEAQAAELVARKSRNPFCEVWTFARRAGAPGKQAFGALTGRCPNCGAEYPGGPTAQCAYCKAIVNSGYYDWVLCEITQVSEWRPPSASEDLSAPLRAKDPSFSEALIEDRASLVFWRWLGARVQAEPALLAAVCAPELRAKIGADIESQKASGQTSVYRDAAVGAAELVDVELGDEFDAASVLIRWSARIGNASQDDTPFSRRATVFRLERDANAKAPEGRGLATSRCGNCGAVATHDVQIVCESCGKELGARSTDWVLVSFTSLERWSAERNQPRAAPKKTVAEELPTPDERRRLLQTLVALARADGSISPREWSLLVKHSVRWHLPRAELDAMIDQPTPEHLDLPAVGDPSARAFLAQLAEMARADGRVDRAEKALLVNFASRLGVSDEELAAML